MTEFIPEVLEEWYENDERRCPFCGISYSLESYESDDGFDGNTHWFCWRYICTECDGRFTVEYEMTLTGIYEEGD